MAWLALRQRGSSVGRHAQTMPILVSTAIQMAAGTMDPVVGQCWCLERLYADQGRGLRSTQTLHFKHRPSDRW